MKASGLEDETIALFYGVGFFVAVEYPPAYRGAWDRVGVGEYERFVQSGDEVGYVIWAIAGGLPGNFGVEDFLG